MSSNRRRRRGSKSNADVVVAEKQGTPKFWKVIWVIVGLLLFMSITSFTGFYAPDIYMLFIFGLLIVFLNIYLMYLLWKDKKVDS